MEPSSMNRRQLLSGIGVAGLGAIAGCNSRFAKTESLGPPTVENPEPGVYYYDFSHRDEHVVNVDVGIRRRSAPGERAKLSLSVGPQTDGWKTDRIRFTLRAPPAGPPSDTARVLLDVDTGASYPLSLRVTEQGDRVIEFDGLADAELGTSTIPLELELVPKTAVESLALQSETRWRGPDETRFEASFTGRLAVPTSQ